MLLDCDRIDGDIERYFRSAGSVFAEFGHLTQDSGNVSYGVEIEGERYFVKTAGPLEDAREILAHPVRVQLLRNAARLRAMCDHHTLPRLYRVIESPTGPLLIYEWLTGELLGATRERREDPASAFQRFRALPVALILHCLDQIFDLHEQIALAGWVAVDFYDGCLIYDFASGRLGIVDLDMYSQGPLLNTLGRMFGSTRFMSPEEFEKGARIDQRSNVFVMGRTALVFLSDGTLKQEAFRGSRKLFDVVAQACDPERSRRFDSMADFCRAWRAARMVSAGVDVIV
jgi:serine/threonine-protein kinase